MSSSSRLASSVPELDCPMSFVDLCCIFAEETNDKLADLTLQYQQQPSSSPETAPRAQLAHLNTALLSLVASLQQLHATVTDWRVQEDDEEVEDGEQELDAEKWSRQPEESESAVAEVEAEAELEKENEQPVAPSPVSSSKARVQALSGATCDRLQQPFSILASPAQVSPCAQPLAVRSMPSFATPISHRRGRDSGCSDAKSATQHSAQP